jgi:hypothetical protein
VVAGAAVSQFDEVAQSNGQLKMDNWKIRKAARRRCGDESQGYRLSPSRTVRLSVGLCGPAPGAAR